MTSSWAPGWRGRAGWGQPLPSLFSRAAPAPDGGSVGVAFESFSSSSRFARTCRAAAPSLLPARSWNSSTSSHARTNEATPGSTAGSSVPKSFRSATTHQRSTAGARLREGETVAPIPTFSWGGQAASRGHRNGGDVGAAGRASRRRRRHYGVLPSQGTRRGVLLSPRDHRLRAA